MPHPLTYHTGDIIAALVWLALVGVLVAAFVNDRTWVIAALVLIAVGCERYEPLVTMPGNLPGTPPPDGKKIEAFASGQRYLVYWIHDHDTVLLFEGVEWYRDRVDVPDVAPLDLWIVTDPPTDDSVYLALGCWRAYGTNRIRFIVALPDISVTSQKYSITETK